MGIQSAVPEGRSGTWAVEKYAATAEELTVFNMRLAFQPGGHRRMMIPGQYTRLVRGGCVIMSDTPAELSDLRPFKYAVTGSVLINGLGLGMAVVIALANDSVTDVTVVEKSEDVIQLVEPSFNDSRLSIIHADAFDWKPPKKARYDAVWHDIWDDICTDNLPQMATLHRRYGRRSDWQGSWCRAECEWHR